MMSRRLVVNVLLVAVLLFFFQCQVSEASLLKSMLTSDVPYPDDPQPEFLTTTSFINRNSFRMDMLAAFGRFTVFLFVVMCSVGAIMLALESKAKHSTTCVNISTTSFNHVADANHREDEQSRKKSCTESKSSSFA